MSIFEKNTSSHSQNASILLTEKLPKYSKPMSFLDPLETFVGLQTPRRLSSPPTQNPGSATDYHPIFNFRFAYLFSIKLLFHLFFLYLICSCTIKSYSLKLLNQIKPNLAGMVSGWVPFKIVSDSPALHSRWLMLLKIEISSFVHCCFCISQNELKF